MKVIDDLTAQITTYYSDIIALLPKVMLAFVLSGIFLLVAKWIRRRIARFMKTRSQDLLLPIFIDQAVGITIIILTILLFLYVIGQISIAKGILGAAGVSAFVIGFAFKDIGENFLAGVILAFDRPFRIGDAVQSANVEGVIVEMNLRETHIKTFDGKDVYVPNGQILKNPLYNSTIDGFIRRTFVVGVDYNSDIELARKVIVDTLATIPGILTQEKRPSCMVSSFDTSSITITAHFWINTFDKKYSSSEVHSQAMQSVLQALTDHGINMPGTIIEVKNYLSTPSQTPA